MGERWRAEEVEKCQRSQQSTDGEQHEVSRRCCFMGGVDMTHTNTVTTLLQYVVRLRIAANAA